MTAPSQIPASSSREPCEPQVIEIRTWAPGEVALAERLYAVAGLFVLSDQPIEAFGPFELPRSEVLAHDKARGEAEAARDSFSVELRGELAGAERTVRVRSSDAAYEIEIPGLASFRVSGNGTAIWRTGSQDTSAARLETALLGPPMMLAMALQGVFCLHGAAIANGGRTIALVGGSGSGKSTLARAAEDLKAGARLADDVLPVRLGRNALTAYPRFPQLKLSEPEQYLDRDPSILDAIVVVNARPAAEEVGIQALEPQQAVKVALKHVIASRLFPPELGVRHLEVAAHLASSVRFWRLDYPHRRGAERVAIGMLQDLDGGAAARKASVE